MATQIGPAPGAEHDGLDNITALVHHRLVTADAVTRGRIWLGVLGINVLGDRMRDLLDSRLVSV